MSQNKHKHKPWESREDVSGIVFADGSEVLIGEALSEWLFAEAERCQAAAARLRVSEALRAKAQPGAGTSEALRASDCDARTHRAEGAASEGFAERASRDRSDAVAGQGVDAKAIDP